MTGDGRNSLFQPGDLVNNTYRVESVLGRGGTSEVYRARSETSGKVVAIKALRSEFSRNDDYLALLTREEEIRELRHPAIVRYYDTQRTASGDIYLLMDFIDGPGLDRKLRDGGMSAADLMVVAERVASGLQVAHTQNIVHRDMSPNNIILRNGAPGEAVIIDFGIAKDLNPGAETIVGGEFAGTYSYAAPEQLSGRTDARSDIYSLGAVLLATFRGKKPDVGRNPLEVIERKAKPLDTEGVPEPLRTLINRMTAPDPANRLQSAADVLGMIRDLRSPGGRPALQDDDDAEKTVLVPAASLRAGGSKSGGGQSGGGQAGGGQAGKTGGARDTRALAAAPERKGSRAPLMIGAVTAVLAVGAGGGYFAGLFDSFIGQRLELAQPFVFVAERQPSGFVRASGFVPAQEIAQSIESWVGGQGGLTDLSLARGEIAESWGPDLLRVLDVVSGLEEWRIAVRDNNLRITGLSADRAQKERLTAALAPEELPPAFRGGTVEIELGPRVLQTSALTTILQQHSDCGPLGLVDAPTLGYPNNATIIVSGQVADPATLALLRGTITEMMGERRLRTEIETLNPTLCKLNAALPTVPSGGVGIHFGYGDKPGQNDSGLYFVGENPVIDVTIPAHVTTGYLYVVVLSSTGNVIHLLPNMRRPENSIEALRGGGDGPVRLRIAYGLAEAEGTERIAITILESPLGKSRILVLYSEEQIFDTLRPLQESAEGFAQALSELDAPIVSVDSRILTSALAP